MRENFPGDHMSGAFEADAAETAPAPVRQGDVYTGSIAFLKGLEVKKSRDRIYFESTEWHRGMANHYTFLFVILLIRVVWKDGWTNDTLAFLCVFPAIIAIYLLMGYGKSARNYYIIDFRENLCSADFEDMTEASFIEMRENKRNRKSFTKKDKIFGVTVNYDRFGGSAPVLLRKNGKLIPLTDYKTGDDYAARADDSAKIVSKLWNLPYYKCPKNSKAVPIALSKDVFDCSFEELE